MDFFAKFDEQEQTFNIGFDAKYVGGGTSDHSALKNRDADNQHPMSAITGLEEALAGKQPNGEYLTEHQKIKTINGESLVGDGDIQIIVEAPHEEILVADLSAAVRMVAEGDPLSFANHNGSMILCASAANDAAFTNRTSETRYLIPIPANADNVTVETTDEKVTLMQFIGVKVVDGAYTKVFATERSAERSCQFEKGVADYIAIDVIYEDTGAVTVPWDYDVTKTTTVAFSVSASGGLPAVTEADNDKLLQVVDGKWTVVALKDSSVKTYIDDYINEALGGEY